MSRAVSAVSAASLVLTVAACARTLWPVTTTQIHAYAPDVFACVQATATDLGYHSSQSDTAHRVYDGRRESNARGFVDPSQIGAADRLRIRVETPKQSNDVVLRIEAQTVSVQQGNAERFEQPESASPRVLDDAAKIRAKCAPATPPAGGRGTP